MKYIIWCNGQRTPHGYLEVSGSRILGAVLRDRSCELLFISFFQLWVMTPDSDKSSRGALFLPLLSMKSLWNDSLWIFRVNISLLNGFHTCGLLLIAPTLRLSFAWLYLCCVMNLHLFSQHLFPFPGHPSQEAFSLISLTFSVWWRIMTRLIFLWVIGKEVNLKLNLVPCFWELMILGVWDSSWWLRTFSSVSHVRCGQLFSKLGWHLISHFLPRCHI